MTQPHSCPGCQCEPLCDLCNGLGFISEWHPAPTTPQIVGIGLPFDHPIWDSLGSGGYTTRKCPRGCPSVSMYYSATVTTNTTGESDDAQPEPTPLT